MFVPEMAPLIAFLMTLNITELECKIGYKGANLVRTATSKISVVNKIVEYCDAYDIQCKVSPNSSRANTEIFCVFDMDDIYSLKG